MHEKPSSNKLNHTTCRVRTFYIVWGSLLVFILLFNLWGLDRESVWFDESHTSALVKHSFSDIIRICVSDYHPPLYFLLARCFVSIFGNSIVILRILSVIGVLLLFCLSLYPLRRYVGDYGALFFGFLVAVVPVFSSMAQDARMYTWGCFFVSAAVLFAYGIITERRISNWFLFGFFTLCAGLTHHYALLGVTLLNIFLFFYFIIINRKKLLPYLLTAIIIVAFFSPWLLSLAGQVGRVTDDFWIPDPDGNIAFNTISFFFDNKFVVFESGLDTGGIVVVILLMFHAL
jgi:uncharacterized membrane protein